MKYKKLIPHFTAIVIFLLITFLYFIQPISESKVIDLPDLNTNIGGSQEAREYQKNEGEPTLWANGMFSGMPTYLVLRPPGPKLLMTANKIINLNKFHPVDFVFLYFLGFYIALLCFRVNPWLSIVGALAYAFSSYFFIIIAAGHAAKITALGYLPAIIGGFHLAYNGKKLLGALIMTLFLALQMLVNHPQMTYYTLIIVAVYGVVLFSNSITEKRIKSFLISSALLSIGAIIALGCNLGIIMPTLEYTEYSIRGKSDLVLDEKNQTSGLDIDYATQWSYGIAETFTLLIPNFMGGASGGAVPKDGEIYKLYERQGKAVAKRAIKQQPTYWGDVIYTSGPVYVGAIVMLLFIFAFFVVEKKYVWWLATATFVSFIFAWGRNIPSVTQFLFEYLPGYNKFRAVSSALVIAQFTIPLLAFLGLNKLFRNEIPKDRAINAIKYSLILTGGLILFIIVFAKGLFNFEGLSDEQYLAQKGGDIFVDALRADRLTLLRNDAFRSLVFVVLSVGVLFFYIKDKLKLSVTIVCLGLLVLIDMWGVNRRYLNNDNFISKKEKANPFVPTVADKAILTDKDANYRVLNLAVSTFNDASTSYYHKSIGGYHGAKMRRYQELIDFHISKEMQAITSSFSSRDINTINKTLSNANVLNMLNTKYLIYNPGAPPLTNNHHLGNAWFIDSVIWVENANKEIEALNDFKPERQAVIDQSFKAYLDNYEHANDSVASIKLVSYAPNKLIYTSNSKVEKLCVFSEIYYPAGWKVKIDDNQVEHIRANYILRALKIPAGQHSIEFSFEPETYYKGQKLAKASSFLLLFLMLSIAAYEIYKARKPITTNEIKNVK